MAKECVRAVPVRRSRSLGWIFTAAAALAAAPVAAQPSAPQTDPSRAEVGRYRLQSNAWVNLHQRLMYDARFGEATPADLAGEDLSRWKRAVDGYRGFLGRRSPIADDGLVALNTSLSAAGGAQLPAGIPKAAADALASAMPLYRSAQWDADDRANRFWIALAVPMLASAGEELAAAHSKAYGVPFPTRILVDVTAFAWEFGAYTVGEGESAHSVIASQVTGNQGFGALESLMHEPSHAIVGGGTGAIGTELAKFSAELGIRPMASLWHAILFYTSSELTRQALAKRGVRDYQPFILGMYERGFRGFRKSLETHWQAYLDGKTSRDAAIRQILIETAPPPKKSPGP
jgi:hypothetical protein